MKKLIIIIARLLGAKYLLNYRSLEIHQLNNLQRSCFIYQIGHFRLIWRKKTIIELQRQDPEINGCLHCFTEFNTD